MIWVGVSGFAGRLVCSYASDAIGRRPAGSSSSGCGALIWIPVRRRRLLLRKTTQSVWGDLSTAKVSHDHDPLRRPRDPRCSGRVPGDVSRSSRMRGAGPRSGRAAARRTPGAARRTCNSGPTAASLAEPTPIEQLSLTPGVIPVLVDVTVEDTPVRVNISIGERLLQRLDAAAEAKGMTRSGFIAQAVRVSLGERGLAPEFEAATRRLQDELRPSGAKNRGGRHKDAFVPTANIYMTCSNTSISPSLA